jgi:hypothetical protein
VKTNPSISSVSSTVPPSFLITLISCKDKVKLSGSSWHHKHAIKPLGPITYSDLLRNSTYSQVTLPIKRISKCNKYQLFNEIFLHCLKSSLLRNIKTAKSLKNNQLSHQLISQTNKKC